MLGNNPQVLDGTETGRVADTLDRSTPLLRTQRHLKLDEPSGVGKKAPPLRDLAHQTMASTTFAQAGKYIGVDLVAKTLEFGFRMGRQERTPPGQHEVACWQR